MTLSYCSSLVDCFDSAGIPESFGDFDLKLLNIECDYLLKGFGVLHEFLEIEEPFHESEVEDVLVVKVSDLILC